MNFWKRQELSSLGGTLGPGSGEVGANCTMPAANPPPGPSSTGEYSGGATQGVAAHAPVGLKGGCGANTP